MQAENLRAEVERLEGEVRAARERVAELELRRAGRPQHYAQAEHRLISLEAQPCGARDAVESAEREAAQAHDDLAARASVHREQTGEVTAAESRLHTIEELENSLEGHVPGTRAVVEAWQRGELGGIEGIVSNLITTDERYARAMERAFGARLSNIVTRTTADAERAIELPQPKRIGARDVPAARYARQSRAARTAGSDRARFGRARLCAHARPHAAAVRTASSSFSSGTC